MTEPNPTYAEYLDAHFANQLNWVAVVALQQTFPELTMSDARDVVFQHSQENQDDAAESD